MVSRYLYNGAMALALAVAFSLIVLLVSTVVPYLSPIHFVRAKEFVYGFQHANATTSKTCYLIAFRNSRSIAWVERKVPFVVYVLASSSGNLTLQLRVGNGSWSTSICVEGWGIEEACKSLSYVSGVQILKVVIPGAGAYVVTVNASPTKSLRGFVCRVKLQAMYTYRPTDPSLVLSYAALAVVGIATSLGIATYLARRGVGWGFGGWVCGTTWLPFMVGAMVATYVAICSPITSSIAYGWVGAISVGTPLCREESIVASLYTALLSIAPIGSASYIATLAILGSVTVSLAFASTHETRTELYEAVIGLSRRRMFAWKLVSSTLPVILAPLATYATVVLVTYLGITSFAPTAVIKAIEATFIALCIALLPVCATSTLLSVATKRCFVPITFGGLVGIAMITKLRDSLSSLVLLATSIAWGAHRVVGYEYPREVPEVAIAVLALSAILYLASYAIFARREL